MDGSAIDKEFNDLRESYRREMKAAGLVECPACDGMGIPEDDDDKDCCQLCQGDAWVFPKQLN